MATDALGSASHADLSRWMYSQSCTRRMSQMLAASVWTTVEMQGDRGGARIPKTGEASTCGRGETGTMCGCLGGQGYRDSVRALHCMRAGDVFQAAGAGDDDGGGGERWRVTEGNASERVDQGI